MTGVSNPTTDSARLVLAEAKKALTDDSLTEQGLRDILQTVKDAIASLESIKESQSATKDVLENSQEELQKAVLFLADEKGSEHTEAELIDNLKEVIAKLKANA
ncbi:surface anchored protein [Streptococcus pneumoniae]|nr:surface anchored protein [Streptococcus pneumoniae]VPB40913.1 surface anchored protein [Streptococcus pneumoniae]